LSPPAARRLLRKRGFQILRTDFLFCFPRQLTWLRWLELDLARLPLGPSIKSFARSLNDRASNDHEASFHSPLFGVPMRTSGGKWEIVQRLAINDFSRSKIDASVAELKEEKSLVSELL
jgi:hypothetical protein